MKYHALEFVDKIPDIITNKTQLQRFLGYLNYVRNFYKDFTKDRSLLTRRLQKHPEPLSEAHSEVVRRIKIRVKTLPILHILDEDSYKIVETDANSEGWG